MRNAAANSGAARSDAESVEALERMSFAPAMPVQDHGRPVQDLGDNAELRDKIEVVKVVDGVCR